MAKRADRIIAAAEYDLPASLSREIGRIIVRWAHFEYAVRRIIWDMMGVNPKLGRIGVRDPRMDGRFDMILDIAHLKKITVDSALIKDLSTKAAEVLRWRDLLGHGIWIPNKGEWMVQVIKGQYPKNYEAEHRKRIVNPEGVTVDLEGLRSVTASLEYLIDEAKSLRARIAEQLQLSPEKYHEG